MCVYIFFFMSSTLTIRVFVNCVVMVSCSTQNWAVRSYTSVCACCKLQEHKRVIGMVASPWFPIITVMNPRLLCIHRCSSNCSAVKWLSPKIGVGCFSTLSLWQQGIFFLRWFHHMMAGCPNASSVTSAGCVCVCVRQIPTSELADLIYGVVKN